MDDKLLAARDMFWAYSCSGFQIDRDGAGAKYRELGGCREHETQWRDEYIHRNVELAQTNIVDGMRLLSYAQAQEALNEVMSLRNYGDDYEKFWYAFYLSELARLDNTPKGVRAAARKRAANLWNEIVHTPLKVTPENRQKVHEDALKAFRAESAEEYFTRFSRRKLAEAEQQGIVPDALTSLG